MDRFEYEGKTYVAKDSDEACHSADGLRTPCAFYSDNHACGDRADSAPCVSDHRADGRYIIWVEEDES